MIVMSNTLHSLHNYRRAFLPGSHRHRHILRGTSTAQAGGFPSLDKLLSNFFRIFRIFEKGWTFPNLTFWKSASTIRGALTHIRGQAFILAIACTAVPLPRLPGDWRAGLYGQVSASRTPPPTRAWNVVAERHIGWRCCELKGSSGLVIWKVRGNFGVLPKICRH